MVSKAQKRATENYNKTHYDALKVYVKKGERDKLKEKAKEENKSLNQYVTDKIYKE